ncbi:hypothetical protein PSTT_10751 [Puccinia striiformis]|uniref:Chromo domain-containing protein n=1 Tax=Puccinia striiformis TaxID=27350 RepID=A0A2S4V313_9BASI|nr:hypothetical protein PSTT_10751 [Puccinia striiformis]
MTPAGSPTPSSIVSDDDTERSFSDTEGFLNEARRSASPEVNGSERSYGSDESFELDWIEGTKWDGDPLQRYYRLKFRGYPKSEWQHERNVDALELVRCFWENDHRGDELCIEAQQQLIREMDERSDPEDMRADLHPRDRPSTSGTRQQKGKQRQQLKPRIRASSEQADSDSSSEDEDEDEDDTRPLRFRQISLLHSMNTPGNPSSSYFEYQPRDPELRELLKITALETEIFADAQNLDELSSKQEILAAYHYRRQLEMSKLGKDPRSIECPELQLDQSSYSSDNPELAGPLEKALKELESLKLDGVKGRKMKITFKEPGQRITPTADGRKERAGGGFISHPERATPLNSPTTRPYVPTSYVPPAQDSLSNMPTDSRDSDERSSTATLRASPHPPSQPLKARPDASRPPILNEPSQTPESLPKRALAPILRPANERRLNSEEEEAMMLQANPRLKRKFVDTHQQQEQQHPFHHTINFSPTESPIPASNQITTPYKQVVSKILAVSRNFVCERNPYSFVYKLIV